MGRTGDNTNLNDPLALAIAPPADETADQRHLREAAEAEAKRISDEIDEQIRRDREQMRKIKKPVKLLLLGQSESGKTATLKNFQLTYARKEWAEEKAAWRPVVFLNFVRNVNVVVSHLSSEMSDIPYDAYHYNYDNYYNYNDNYNSNSNSNNNSEENLTSPRPRALARIKFTEKHQRLRDRLAPLANIQRLLENKLGSASFELRSTSVNTAAPFEHHDGFSSSSAAAAGASSSSSSSSSPLSSSQRRGGQYEFSVHSSNGWKSALDRLRSFGHAGGGTSPSSSSSSPTTTRSPVESGKGASSSSSSSPREVAGGAAAGADPDDQMAMELAKCRTHIKDLWEDDIVAEVLSRRKVRLEDSAGFFIADADRIASVDYQPTDDDVVRARLRTLGVQEYRFIFDHGPGMGQEWRLYDVGGTRSNRQAWHPYFDDVDSIIFLAPVSSFDEKLAEDKSVNRLEDSYMLWRSVCSCKLLAKTHLILFLNKCDLLQAKLQRGVRVRESVPSFGDRKNDFVTVVKYFQQHFKDISRKYSGVPRPFYFHLTSVVDTRSTATTLETVEEGILREHLRKASLM